MKIEDKNFGERTGYVLVEGQEVPIDDTVFLNISEDIYGRDLYTFKYNGKEYSSNVFLR
jgi:hypothetical protein